MNEQSSMLRMLTMYEISGWNQGIVREMKMTEQDDEK